MRTSAAIPGALDIIEAFERACFRFPDRPAIIHNGQIIDYHTLGSMVRATARELGPRPGVVGVLTTRTPGTVVGLLAVLAAGGTYCPLDPTFPAPRQQAMLAVAGCRTVLASRPDLVEPVGVRRLDISARPDAADLPVLDADTDRPYDPDDAAYVLFTSGSTGDPKPVAVSRAAIATTVRSLRDLFDIEASDRVLQYASLNWDTCFEEILPTLTGGAALVFHDEAYSGSLPRMLRMIAAEGITVLDLPTAFWHELVHYLLEARLELPVGVRAVVIGGEAVSPARLADWCALPTANIRLINTYGCTETTLITHAVDLHGPRTPPFGEPWQRAGRVPIGWALPHVVEHITADGELLVGGPAVALGYLGQPEATDARFVSVDLGPAVRCFQTGDRVSRSADGLLVHLGRLDSELKVRGIRVDPAEVEAQIGDHPDVAAVAVVGAAVNDHTALIGYVVLRPDAVAADLRSYLRARVPGHLIPSRITVVPALAYTTSGKVDRSGTHRRYAATDPAGRASMSVDSVIAIFRRVLETGAVAADSDFFAMGGDSLSATRVLSAIARESGAELSFEDFVVAPTPDALVKKIACMAQ
jgi:amino acid adenylation domain-containing protein